MAGRQKRGEDGNAKVKVSREQKKLFQWKKGIFHSFSSAIICWKNKSLIKIANTSVKIEAATTRKTYFFPPPLPPPPLCKVGGRSRFQIRHMLMREIFSEILEGETKRGGLNILWKFSGGNLSRSVKFSMINCKNYLSRPSLYKT